MENQPSGSNTLELATLGGGCFWCLEAVFLDLVGVAGVESGYAGGRPANPSYEEVCSGDSGHAEVVQIRFDPAVISYREILEVFFSIHDPTTLNRQGNDVGSQYRSVIFAHTPEQLATARQFIAELSEAHIWPNPIVTEVLPAPTFYRAEDYHQDYYRRHESQPYCQVVVAPKLAKFRNKFADKRKATA